MTRFFSCLAFFLPSLWMFPSAASAGETGTALPTLGELSVQRVEPAPCETSNFYFPGERVVITGVGFAPNEEVEVRLSQETITHELSSVRAEADGKLSVVVIVPNVVKVEEVGALEARGAIGAGGGGTLLSTGFMGFVASPMLDKDRDGVQDRCDVCVDTVDPEQRDSDSDGRGDACDPCKNDPEDDFDKDGRCADVDADPLDPEVK